MKFAAMKYQIGDQVRFIEQGTTYSGEIFIADFGGSLENDYHSYDIAIPDAKNMSLLYKHIPEGHIVELTKLAATQPFTQETGLNLKTASGRYVFETQSGSRYLVTIDGRRRSVMRVNEDYSMRKDDSQISLLDLTVVVGRGAVLILEALGDGPVTTRLTSPVLKIAAVDDAKADR